jgi:hypothetical protein
MRRKVPDVSADDALIEAADSLALRRWQSSVQIFASSGGAPLVPLGSAVLVQLGGEQFLFSAAHVLAEAKTQKLFVSWVDSGLPVELKQVECLASGHPKLGNHEDDRVDYAVAWIPKIAIPSLDERAVDEGALEVRAPGPQTGYVLLGFPANRTSIDKVREEIEVERKPFVLRPVETAAAYIAAGRYPNQHLLFEWRNEWTTLVGAQHEARALGGASGGAIWQFDLTTPT